MMDSKDPMKDLARNTKNFTFEARVDVHFGLFLPDKKGEKYYIKFKWGETKIKTSEKESKGRMCEWFDSLKLDKVSFPMSAPDRFDEVI